MGIALRRVLLSALGRLCNYIVSYEGVDHEFSTISGCCRRYLPYTEISQAGTFWRIEDIDIGTVTISVSGKDQ
jgi:hypothetical protein